jgi:hypothetical protein
MDIFFNKKKKKKTSTRKDEKEIRTNDIDFIRHSFQSTKLPFVNRWNEK